MAKVGKVYHPDYLLHDTGWGHPERPDRLRAILEMLEKTGIQNQLQDIPAREATLQEISLVHDRDYIEAVAQTAKKRGVYLDGDTFASPESYQASLLAVGGLLAAVDQVMDGKVNRAFAMVRPPGHHAERTHAMGFCIFNNVGVAAEYLIKKYGLKKVAVVDFDVHHGNATQHMFYDRPDIFYLSIHRYPFYPGTGAASERGSGAGLGYTLNVPMQAGSDDLAYQKMFEEKIIPALKEYQPQFLLVSAGFDAHRLDPLGGMQVTKEGFGIMATKLEKIAQDYCDNRAVYTLEGGYDLQGLSDSTHKIFQILLSQ